MAKASGGQVVESGFYPWLFFYHCCTTIGERYTVGTREWETRELKDRMRHITTVLYDFLPPVEFRPLLWYNKINPASITR